jgi:cellulose synthase/poly-beta-1,6-N-acetylglucosamine synthase-like glycosyltransferase
VMRFNEAPENVVCLQGILDYYNPRENWISRCFTIEYATWWRLVLPGISKLGLVLPLGGTTLFFKRDALEKLGRWDAHNVTEDADLGVRLARHGYVTELIPTVTFEEANCRPWRWVRQRSRWLKGFMITYFVHMRDPIQLIRDLGFARFMGLQMIFLATFSQFALAPLLWSFWITMFGVAHPVQSILGDTTIMTLIVLFFLSEILNITMALTAVSSQHHRHLMKWVLTMPLYFTLGALASYKAIYEMIVTPFYWDKTEHGVTKEL